MNISELSAKYSVRRLTEADTEMIYDLSVGNPLYFKYCPPFVTREGVHDDMTALPPGCGYEDKYYIGFFDGDRLAAVMDLIFHYPQEDVAYIGLFMVDKELQGAGVGAGIIKDCLLCLKGMGFGSVGLAYARGNPQSEGFWLKNGFVKTGEEKDMGGYVAVKMTKALN